MRRASIALVCALLLAFAPTTSAHAGYIGWHWSRRANPFTVNVVLSTVNGYIAPVQGATTDWSKSTVLDMTFTVGNQSRTARNQCSFSTTHLIVHACDFNYGPTGWAGLTEAHVNSSHHITAIRVRWNDYYVTSSFRRTVACHELGHTLGLSHRTESSSCMKQG